MKRIGEKRNSEGYVTEAFELSDLIVPGGCEPGAVTAYLTAVCPDVALESFRFSSAAEDGNALAGDGAEFAGSYSSPAELSMRASSLGLGPWELVFTCRNVRVTATGQFGTRIIGVRYPSDSDPRTLLLLSGIENSSYELNEFDPGLVETLMRSYSLTKKTAVRELADMSAYEDIYGEFRQALESGGKPVTSGAVSEQGITAADLMENFPLSLLGAYNYLIYLRESPDEALEELRNGLPRK